MENEDFGIQVRETDPAIYKGLLGLTNHMTWLQQTASNKKQIIIWLV